MTQPKKQLDDLLGSVSHDTPSLKRDELRSLLEQKTSGNLPMSPMQTTIISEDRRRGFYKKGIIIMTLIGVFFTAMLLLFSTREENKLTAPKMALTVQHQVQNEPITTHPIHSSENATVTQLSKTKDSLKYLGFNPVDLSCVSPVQITTEDMNRIGFLQAENGEIVFYHASTKVGFPMSEKTKSYPNSDKDERVSHFNKIPFHPSYATDAKGNLLFMYKYTNDKNGEIIMTNFGDDNDEVNKLLNSNYIPIQSIIINGDKVDSSRAPWLITSHYHIRNGIMSYDTVMTWKKDVETQWTPIQPIINNLRAKDSVYKMQFGGEPGLRIRFQFPTEYSKLTRIEHTIQDSLNKIEKKYSNRKELLVAQQSYLWSVAETTIPDTLKLIIEQLTRKIGYEGYILAHQEEEKELENITTLIPIKVRENTGMKTDGKYDNGLIFWYEQTTELFKALPQLQKTLAAEICPIGNGVGLQNVLLYPNPANMYLFVKYTIAQTTNVSISILDLSGKLVEKNIPLHLAQAGENKESITLGDIPPGVYIVVLRTDSGEQSSRRLVITK